MRWIKESIRAIPEAREPDGDSRILLKSKLFWLSDIQTKLDELTERSESSADDQHTQAVNQRYRKESDGPATLLYRSEKLGWLPVLAVEHYPVVCRNVTRITDESIWSTSPKSRRNRRRQQDYEVELSVAAKGRQFGKYMSTQYHLNAGLMEKFYVWIEDHKHKIEQEEREQEEKLNVGSEVDLLALSVFRDEHKNSMRDKIPQVSPQYSDNPVFDDEFSCSIDLEGYEAAHSDPTGHLSSHEYCADRRVQELEDQNFVLTTRVSALECRNIALEGQVRSMMQALRHAGLLP